MRPLFPFQLDSCCLGLLSLAWSRTRDTRKAEQKACERADTVPVLDCQSCGGLTPGERFRYYADQIVCEACEERNPQSRWRTLQSP